MIDRSVPCPSCRSGACRFVGKIPAGSSALNELPSQPAALYSCDSCSLQFKHPRPSAEELSRIYAAAQPAWAYDPQTRLDWERALAFMEERLPGGSVLDVGCYDGAFLCYAGSGFKRYGIEPNTAAAARAREQGIELAGSDLSAVSVCVDCVTAFDVIEHVPDPLAFLESAAARMKPGGFLIIATGNAEAPSFRFMRGGYWYCQLPEHLSFISPAWAQRAAEKLGLKVIRTEAYSHLGRPKFHTRMFEALANVAYRLSPSLLRLCRLLLKAFRGGDYQTVDHAPSWASSRDHVLIIFEKPR
ncbi:MAG TPA: class I SAM-dependent methyltransferase [Planctomycetota bacterium]|nr:class I SAM-dependent methyltransferase [Planctomycetota bacterium]